MSVVLPTGDVLHFGGNGISEQFSDDDALLLPGACTPELGNLIHACATRQQGLATATYQNATLLHKRKLHLCGTT